MNNALFSVFRHEPFCRPGLYMANLTNALGVHSAGWHVHADCVVDDFGTLVPVAFRGMTVSGSFNTERAQ